MGWQPYGEQVLLQIIAPDEMTKGGIIIPETSRKRPDIGVVLKVGPGKMQENGQVRPVGKDAFNVTDKVIFLRFSGMELKGPEGEPWILVHESAIIAVYERE